MDPKKLQGIDPKLQEAYNRIMASPAPTPSSTPPPAAPQTNSPPSTPSVSPEPKPTAPLTPPPLPTLTPIGTSSKTPPATGKVGGTDNVPVGMIAKKGGAGISPIILIVAAVIFFLVYALFFIKLFNVSVPFLP